MRCVAAVRADAEGGSARARILHHLVRFEHSPDSLMRTDDRADALSRYCESSVYQRNRAHLCLLGPVIHPRPERTRRQAPRLALQTACRRRFANNVPRGVKTRERRREPTTLSARPRTLERRRRRCLRRSSRLEGGHVFQQVMRYFGLHLWSVPRFTWSGSRQIQGNATCFAVRLKPKL
jgi:hypothetical protein